MSAIDNNQVVIIAGETGSGKTTQIPKMCLELGRGTEKIIGHTQPRRIAARSVAERIAEELGEKVGEDRVSYKIRFDDRTAPHTSIKLMTEGILLAEIQSDPLLEAYDTIIIDEAHERSLNIDFLIGYLRLILPKRPDLKIIITSATIDPESFATHFADQSSRPAPIIEVSGRTYPVEIRYRPLDSVVEEEGENQKQEIDLYDALQQACQELMDEGPGDILCFFSGEREIRDAQDLLSSQGWNNVEILPLFGRLSSAEQHKIFSPSGSHRRIILATNIAETSLTVPGIHYVVDTGVARISRYSHRTKVQRLPIEPISQASANQRSGRSGRIAEGIAIRLYSEEDFLSRPSFTDPEILRTHLASVILSMSALGLGDIESFPFLEAPDKKSIRDGIQLLEELGALSSGSLTPVGRDMARIPTDPRLSRMLIAAHQASTHSSMDSPLLYQMAIIVAALSIQDVRERPLEKQAEADEYHQRFARHSDFLSILLLWNYLQTQRQKLSGNKFRALCRREYIHYLRFQEWMELVRQLLTTMRSLRWSLQKVPHIHDLIFDTWDEDELHKSIFAGLLTHIGMRDLESRHKVFRGTRNTQFLIHPSSSLSKQAPQWVMAAELVETSQVFARILGPVKPEWLEEIAPHLLKYQYSDPYWSSRQGRALAHEKVLFLGLPIIADRNIGLDRTDPHAARELFIRHALVYGQWNTHHHFFHRNQELIEDIEALEAKTRRRDIIADETVIFDFYSRKLPQKITSARHFDSWWKKKKQKHPHYLDLHKEDLISSADSAARAEDFPDTWKQGSLEFELSYQFAPGDKRDGISMHIPVPLLKTVDATAAQWLVSGLREELCIALIKSLPKKLRTSVVPASQYARAALEKMTPFDGALDQSLADRLRTLGGVGIHAEDFQWEKVPPHLTMNFLAIDKQGEVIDHDRNLSALQERLAGSITQGLAQAAVKTHSVSTQKKSSPSPSSGSTLGHVLAEEAEWTAQGIGVIPTSFDTEIDGHTVSAYPALITKGSGVCLQAFPTESAAAGAQYRFVFEQINKGLSQHSALTKNSMLKGLELRHRVAFDSYPHGGAEAILDDCRALAVKTLIDKRGPIIRDPHVFSSLSAEAESLIPSLVRQYVVALAPVLLAIADMYQELEQWSGDSIDDMKAQLEFYSAPHALLRHGIENMRHIPRYIKAMSARLSLLETNPDREAQLSSDIQYCLNLIDEKKKRLPSHRHSSPALQEIRWMVEELRVSFFAQNLGTKKAVSIQRIRKALDKIR